MNEPYQALTPRKLSQMSREQLLEMSDSPRLTESERNLCFDVMIALMELEDFPLRADQSWMQQMEHRAWLREWLGLRDRPYDMPVVIAFPIYMLM